MNVVIYTRDMEPITIVDLPLYCLEFGERLGVVRVAIEDEVPLIPPHAGAVPKVPDLRTVSLMFTQVQMPGKRAWIIQALDDELALLLRPSWLPGQRRKINEYERNNRRLASMLLDVLARGVGGH